MQSSAICGQPFNSSTGVISTIVIDVVIVIITIIIITITIIVKAQRSSANSAFFLGGPAFALLNTNRHPRCHDEFNTVLGVLCSRSHKWPDAMYGLC